jgi:prepilin-type N-terminal cleavage/methylation domain-containing protein
MEMGWREKYSESSYTNGMCKSPSQVLRMDGGTMKKRTTKFGTRNPEPGIRVTDDGQRTTDHGFTLVEVMIAMVVLLIGMLGVMGMQYYAIGGNTASRELRMATNLSVEMIEQLKSTPYASLVSSGDSPPVGTSISGGVTFARAWWTVPDCIAINFPGDDSTCAGLATACTSDPDATMAVPVSAIRVRTCWTDKDGLPHSVTLDSIRWDENESL